jgi:hypothetical protein
VNARAVNALAGVIHAAMRTHRTAAGIAAAVDAAGMLMSPETAAAHAAEVDRWKATAESWRQRYYAEAGVRWDDELPPGGEVCATCEQPVESEPCPEHNPRTLMAQMDEAARERWIEKQLAETGLRSMDFRNGMAMDIEPARDLVAQWVGAARAMLGDAPNYSETPIEMVVKVGESPERFAFTLQRVGKLTPHEARRQAEARVAELERQAAQPRELWLAEYETDTPRLYPTLAAARLALGDRRNADDPLMTWTWSEMAGVHSQWRTDPDTGQRLELLLGSVMRVIPAVSAEAGEPR